MKNLKRFKVSQEKMSLQKWDAAIQILESLVKKTPKISVFWKNLALCYANKGEEELALKYTQSALELELELGGNFLEFEH